MDTLYHLTINSGHARPSPRAEVGDATIAMLAPLIAAGGGRLPGPFAAYAVTLVRVEGEPDSATFTVERDGRLPLVTCFVFWGAGDGARFWAVVGTRLGQIAASMRPGAMPTRLPRRPSASPWLAVLLWPTADQDRDALAWLGDFERSLAWALIAGA